MEKGGGARSASNRGEEVGTWRGPAVLSQESGLLVSVTLIQSRRQKP
jgi:hypothetical protein